MSSGQANAEIDCERSPALTGLHEAPIVASTLAGGSSRCHSDITSGQQDANIVWQMNHADEAYRDCGEISPTLQSRMGTGGNNVPLIGVRRLTPTECERLQGFPDGWTDTQSDTQRYKQMGNAVTVNVIEWIGRRIHGA
jgi:DNA (cytosine-5)-methyltransferase 1